MGYLTGINRTQTMLLPESLEDYVAGEHPVRLVDAFVDGLDLAQCGFGRTQPKEIGRPTDLAVHLDFREVIGFKKKLGHLRCGCAPVFFSVFQRFLKHRVVLRPADVHGNRRIAGLSRAPVQRASKTPRRYSMLPVAMRSGPSVKSKTSTDTTPSYPDSRKAAAMGLKSTSPKPGPLRLRSLAWK